VLQPADPDKLPAVVVEQTELDAGDILRGQPQHFTFVLKNTGAGPLEIRAKPRCGCTVAHFDKVIPPGGQGQVETELRTASLNGRVKKSVAVQTNDPVRPKFELTMTANIVTAIEVLPTSNPFITLKRDGPTVHELCLRPHAAGQVELTGVTCSVPYARAVLEPSTDPAKDRAYRLTLTVGPEAPMGRSSFQITVATTAATERNLTINARWEKGITVLPANLLFRRPGPGQPLPAPRTVLLSKREGKFHIQKVTSSDPNLDIRTDTVKDGSSYRLKVAYRSELPDVLPPARITVETDDPQQPRLEIPVTSSGYSLKTRTRTDRAGPLPSRTRVTGTGGPTAAKK
jgi:hypothetical protein